MRHWITLTYIGRIAWLDLNWSGGYQTHVVGILRLLTSKKHVLFSLKNTILQDFAFLKLTTEISRKYLIKDVNRMEAINWFWTVLKQINLIHEYSLASICYSFSRYLISYYQRGISLKEKCQQITVMILK